MTGEISKHTITVLVILTVIISFLGTWTVMNAVSEVPTDNGDGVNNANPANLAGKVSLNVEPNEPVAIGSGQVSLGIN